MITDTEIRMLALYEPHLEVPRKSSGVKFCAEEGRVINFACAVLENINYADQVHANTIIILAEMNMPERYSAHVPLFIKVALRSDWLCRLMAHEVLHNVLYPDKHLLPLLFEAVVSHSTPLETRYQLVEVCRMIAHPSFTPQEGFDQFLAILRERPPMLLEPKVAEVARAHAAGMRPAHEAGSVSALLSAIHVGVPDEVQVSVTGLATVIMSRDLNSCEQAILENQYHEGVAHPTEGGAPFFLWRHFGDLLSSKRPSIQKAMAKMLNTLFWRLPQDTVELTTRPRGQSSEEYWMLPRLLYTLGHPEDPRQPKERPSTLASQTMYEARPRVVSPLYL